MRESTIFIGFLSMFLLSTSAFSAGFAELVGVYKAENGKCKQSEFLGQLKDDYNMNGVCIPSASMIDPKLKDLILLAVTELNNPDILPMVIAAHKESRKPVEIAFVVEIDDYDDDIFKLVDGSKLENQGGYVGYTSYHQDAVLFKKNNQWKICVNDDIHRVKMLKDGGAHYSRDRIYEQVSEKEIEEMEECD
jgi:hypothetical protein